MHQQLQKAFRVTEQQLDVIVAVQKVAAAVLSSLSNAAEQLDCCNKVHIEDTPLGDFPDLKEVLSFKLMKTMEGKVTVLQQACAKMEAASSQIHRQKEATMTYLNQNSQDLSVSECLKGEPLWPSVATMLEWLEDMDNAVYWLYCEKQHLVDTLDFNNVTTIETLETRWKDDQKVKVRLKDVMLQLQFFMEEKF